MPSRKFTYAFIISTIAAISLFLHSCYTFSGASIPPGTKTFSVYYFENRAPLVEPTLSQIITEGLKDKIMRSTSLSLEENNSDIIFEGFITGYNVVPIAITSDGGQNNRGEATQNRLTITMKVKCTNTRDQKLGFDQSFSRYRDFPGSQTLNQVQAALIDEISKELIDDIFNRAFSNW